MIELTETQAKALGAAPQPPVVVDPLTGHLVTADRQGAVIEKCLSAPAAAQNSDYDETGKVILPPAYAAWAKSPTTSVSSTASLLPVASGAPRRRLRDRSRSASRR